MRARLCALIIAVFGLGLGNGYAQEKPVFPTLIWERDSGAGIVLASATEMWVVVANGDLSGKVTTKEAIRYASLSPDGAKVAYITGSGLWIAIVGTAQNYKIAGGYCDHVVWGTEGASILFTLGTESKEGSISNIKVLRADGDGKNLKQVYP